MENLYDKNVLDLVRAGRAETQAELCRLTGLSTSTMSGILRRLRDGGLVQSAGRRINGRGKPTTVLRFAPPGELLAISIDGSQTEVGVANFSGTVLSQATIETGLDPDPASLLHKLEREARKRVAQAGIEWGKLRALGINVNGFVSMGGVVEFSSVLPWRHVPLAQFALDTFGLPVFCTDQRSRAVAEYRHGAGQGSRVMVFFNVGDGVSARAVVNGQLFEGAHRRGGEIGHQVISPSGPVCGCGQRGCLQAFISGPAIERRIINDVGSDGTEKKQLRVKQLLRQAQEGRAARTVEALIQLADEDQWPYAQRLIDEVVSLAAKGLAGAAACFDPDCIVVDGYVFRDHPGLLRRLWQAANQTYKSRTVELVKLMPAQLGPRGRFLSIISFVGDSLAQAGKLIG